MAKDQIEVENRKATCRVLVNPEMLLSLPEMVAEQGLQEDQIVCLFVRDKKTRGERIIREKTGLGRRMNK
jgi:hypothetical protein